MRTLVCAGILTEAEFWQSRQSMLAGLTAANKAQKRGTPSSLLGDVRPTLKDDKQIFKLTAQVIHRIFLMHPAVHRAYMVSERKRRHAT